MPIPTRAKALLKLKENQFARPPNVPRPDPMLLSIKKYVPPALGMAVESSTLDNKLGMTSTPPSMYANITAGPDFAKARPGNIKSPELIMAPDARQKMSQKPRTFFKLFSLAIMEMPYILG